jgi:hypothetical protein
MRMLDQFSKLMDTSNKKRTRPEAQSQSNIGLTSLYREDLGLANAFNLDRYNRSDFIHLISLVDEKQRENYQFMQIDKIASILEPLFDDKSIPKVGSPNLQ